MLLLLAAESAGAASFVVNTLNDSTTVGPCTADPDGCTLREAITAANTNGGAPDEDQIAISVSGDIILQTELPEITTKTTITGPGPGNLTVTRAIGANIRIFTMNGSDAGETIRIQGLTISNGVPQNLIGDPLNGGGVFVDVGGLNFLENVVITGNTASDGGGIFLCCDMASLDVIGSTISGNQAIDANGEGGGIKSSGHLTVKSSTIEGNRVTVAVNGTGGGIWMAETGLASTLVTNSTIAGNSTPSSGGGIYLGNGSLFVESSTIARNTSDSDDAGGQDGGGIYVVTTTGGATLANTILAENNRGAANPVPNQCGLGSMASSLVSDGYNLRSSGGEICDAKFVLNDLIDPNPLLGPLSSNGGPTQTIPLLPGSPALNAANPTLPNGVYPACEPADQRGFPRGGAEGRCDIGAFEGVFQVPVQPSPTPGATTGTIPTVSFDLAAAIKKCKKKFPKGPKRKKCIKRAKRRAQA